MGVRGGSGSGGRGGWRETAPCTAQSLLCGWGECVGGEGIIELAGWSLDSSEVCVWLYLAVSARVKREISCISPL